MKKQSVIDQEIVLEASHICDDFAYFTDGYRVLFLIHRGKEGGNTNNTKFRKIITKNPKEFKAALEELLTTLRNSDEPYRIYSSVNERNFEKAIRQFKHEQLDADYQHEEQKHGFYLDLKNRFIGCLMQPAQRDSSYFLFDIDLPDNSDFLKIIPPEVNIIKQYRTKNGWHIVTEPFNYTVLPVGEWELKKDGLLLLKF